MDGSLTQRLVELVDTADADPLTTIEVVQQMGARDELGDPIDRARAHHAVGIAHRSLGDLGLALIDLSSGIDVADAVGRPDVAALVQLTRAAVHLMTGDIDSCRRDLDTATSRLAPEHEVDGLVQLASVEHRLGNLDDAAANYRTALSLAKLQDRRREEARLHSNLGLLLTETGSYDKAGDHLERAVDMFSSLGLRDGAIFSEHNLGYLRMLEGDLVVALRHFDDANTAAVDIGAAPAANIDKSAALLMAGLPGEALAAAMDAAATLADGDITELSDALTSAARAALRANRPDEAQRLADRALQTAASLGRRGWEASVRAVRLRAAVASQQVAAVDALHEWAVLHDDLVELGVWPLVHDVAVTAAECAAELGSPTEARLWLGRLAHRTPMSPPERAELHHAAALCLRAVGDTTGATEAAGAAVDAARHATSWLGTLDLRLGSSTRQARSARLAAELAFERDDPSRALMWIDISLSAGLDLPPLLPPADPALRGARAELRAARDALAMELSDGDDAEAVRRCVVRVERAEAAAADQLHLTLPNAAEANPNEELPGLPQATTSALWLVVIGSRVVRFHLTPSDLHVADVGHQAQLTREVMTVHQRFRSDVRFGSMGARTQVVLSSLDVALLDGCALADGAVVCVDPLLGPVPLEALPSLRAVAFVAAPSLGQHTRSASVEPALLDGPLLVAGPGLDHGDAEVEAIANRVADAVILSGVTASVETTLAALTTSVVHFACHGHVRPDQPMFSSFQLADGPLALHDFQLLDAPPTLVTAGSCDLGGADGTAHNVDTALLSMGTRTVISSSHQVPDHLTAMLMPQLYASVFRGESAASALAHARLHPELDLVAQAFRITGADITFQGAAAG